MLVDAAGLAVAGIGYVSGGLLVYGFGSSLPWGWEAVMLATAVGLVLYTARTGAPGPGVLALVLLVMFAASAMVVAEPEPGFAPTDEFELEGGPGYAEEPDEPSLLGWPLALVGLAAASAAGARVRRRRP